MIVECINEYGKQFGVEIDPEYRTCGWVHYKHPDGQWVTLRKATDDEMERARAADAIDAVRKEGA